MPLIAYTYWPHIASYLPSRKKKQSKRLFETAEQEAINLRSMEDKYEHHYMIAMLSKNREQSFTRTERGIWYRY